MKKNSLSVIQLLFDSLNVKVTKTSISEELDKHPNDFSLLAISDTLNHWHVTNAAYKLNALDLDLLPVPFIAHLSSNGGKFALIEALDELYVTISNEYSKKQKLKKEDFNQLFTGNVLLAEASGKSGESDYKKKRQNEIIAWMRTPFSISGLIVVYLLSAWVYNLPIFSLHWNEIALVVIKTCGVITSVLLLIHSLDSRNYLVQRLCPDSKFTNCNSILLSKAAKVTSFLSWSEVGLFYFSGSLLAILWMGRGAIIPLAIINIFCLPYTVYSLWYQIRIAKKWCTLCCMVQALLWLEFVVVFPNIYSFDKYYFSASAVTTVLLSFFLPAFCWFIIRPWLTELNHAKWLRDQLKRLKYNDRLYAALMAEQERLEMPDDNNSIILGSSYAKHRITVVSNTHCQPCSRAHTLLNTYILERADIQLQIIFSTPEGKKDDRVKVAAHMMALYKKDSSKVSFALDDWYDQRQKSYGEWSKMYPVDIEASLYKSLDVQRLWCKNSKITGTPTIFINGRRLPAVYSPEDIRYLI